MTANRYFPFHSLGFECNPFRALTDKEWAEVVVLPAEVEGVIEAGYENLQVLGEAGHGKTSLLLYLDAQERFRGRRAAYERIPENGRKFRTPLKGLDCFLLDEAQRLDRRERKRLLKQTKEMRVVLGSHEDLTGLFEGVGRPLVTVSLVEMGRGHLRAVLEKRLAYFALDGQRPDSFSDNMIDELWENFGGNLRRVEQHLYEVFQEKTIK